jgi:hypothetical protein
MHANTSSSRRSNVTWQVHVAHNRYPPQVCSRPLGLPVEPDVYNTNSGCSASTISAGRTSPAPGTTSCHQWSRPAVMPTGLPVWRYTSTWSTGASTSALSTTCLSGTGLPPRRPSSWVITTRAPQSWMRSRSDSAENPPNTTEWTAPSLATANIATTASGIMPM